MSFDKLQFSCILTILLLSLCEKICIGLEQNDIEFAQDSNHEFDLLIFTQRWPITGCIEWMGEGKSHACILPSQKGIWTIHGIWPTRFGTIGPAFCNATSKFDVNELKTIKEQLERYWMNIEKGMPLESLWQHEWLKHGTCASVLDELNSENKYFGQGLAWLKQYTMQSLLAKTDIVPDKQYTALDIHTAIKNVWHVDPSIHCITERHSGEQFLSEIRICFNKKLELVDCDGTKVNFESTLPYLDNQVITNCHNKTINYPNAVPKHLLDNTNSNANKTTWRFPWVNLYKLIQIIKWFTL